MTPIVFRTMEQDGSSCTGLASQVVTGSQRRDRPKTTVAHEKSALDGPISIKHSKTKCFLVKRRRIRLYQ